MKVLNYEKYDDGNIITITNGDETFHYANLTDIDDEKFKLVEYERFNPDKSYVKVIASLEDCSLICTGYSSCRVIKADEDGFVLKDYIRYNERGKKQRFFLNTNVTGNQKIELYLTDYYPKTFVDENGEVFDKGLFDDEIFRDFLGVPKKYADALTDVFKNKSEIDACADKAFIKTLEIRLSEEK